MPRTKFYGSQIGGKNTTPHAYTTSPLSLLYHDILSAFSFLALAPFIILPISPQASGPLCELYPSAANLWCMFLHFILVCLQLPFVLTVPLWLFFPVWSVVLAVVVFMLVNRGLCWLINGSEMKFHSNSMYVEGREEHPHEQWIFLNGVAVGKHWMQSNIDRLALTFGRPVLGVHNKTNGIIFDVLQCLVQRNFTYATQDVRDCYSIVKETLYQPQLTKVVFILHSQGAIEGGLIIDWLLQEVPQDLLAKLEVYTFGNAANHFNNPHLHLLSQQAAVRNPSMAATTRTAISVRYHDPLSDSGVAAGDEKTPTISTGIGGASRSAIATSSGSGRIQQDSASGKTLRYIEHYAHTSDFVARWGVLHFTSGFSLPSSPQAARFMGRVFERAGKGHQLNQHYLDSMFPLKRAFEPSGGIAGCGFTGVDEEGGFMASLIALGEGGEKGGKEAEGGEEKGGEREGLEVSFLGAHGEPLNRREGEVLLRDMSPISPATIRRFTSASSSSPLSSSSTAAAGASGIEELSSEDEPGSGGADKGKGLKGGKSRNAGEGVGEGEGGTQGLVKDRAMRFRVKDLSRLWLYVNGKSPKVDETDVGMARMATL